MSDGLWFITWEHLDTGMSYLFTLESVHRLPVDFKLIVKGFSDHETRQFLNCFSRAVWCLSLKHSKGISLIHSKLL